MLLVALLLSGCAIIRPGQVGVKQSLGKLDTKYTAQEVCSLHGHHKMVVVPIQTTNIEVDLNLPSKEGLNVNASSQYCTALMKARFEI